jgi:hypothetical protein
MGSYQVFKGWSEDEDRAACKALSAVPTTPALGLVLARVGQPAHPGSAELFLTSWVELGGVGVRTLSREGWRIHLPWPGGEDRILFADDRTTPEFDTLMKRLGLDWPKALLARCLEPGQTLAPPANLYRAAFGVASAPELLKLVSTWAENEIHWYGLDAAPHLDGQALLATVAGMDLDPSGAFVLEGLARIARAGQPLPEGWPGMVRAQGYNDHEYGTIHRARQALAALPQAPLRRRLIELLTTGSEWSGKQALTMVPDLVDDEVWAAAMELVLAHAKSWSSFCRPLGDGPGVLPFVRATAKAWKKDKRGKSVVAQDALHAIACQALAATARAGQSWPEADDALLRFDLWKAGMRDHDFNQRVLPSLQAALGALPAARRREVYLRGLDAGSPKTCLRPLACLAGAPCDEALARAKELLATVDAKVSAREDWMERLRRLAPDVHRALA